MSTHAVIFQIAVTASISRCHFRMPPVHTAGWRLALILWPPTPGGNIAG